MIKGIVKKIGDKLIDRAENISCGNCGMLIHEVERPECLKRHDREMYEKMLKSEK